MAGVTDRDLGYKRTLQALAVLSGTGEIPQVLVGVRAKEGAELVIIAASNEFGTARIPERSFLRSTMDENRNRYGDALQRIVGRVLDGGDLATELDRLGLSAVGDVQKKITVLDTPPNAPSTIRRKGTDNPLIETGRLKQSISHEVRGVKGGRA